MEFLLGAIDWLSLLSDYPNATKFYAAFLSTVRHTINLCVPLRHKRRFTGKKTVASCLKGVKNQETYIVA